MAKIVAANFRAKSDADQAQARLLRDGVPGADVHALSLNPPGQHDQASESLAASDQPSDLSSDTKPPHEAAPGAATGAAIGGAVGLGIGLATAPITGPAGPIAGTGVGAYVGSLIGALGGLEERSENEPAIRPAGILVAVRVDNELQREKVAELLYQSGAGQVEVAEGEWRDGKWVNFDPQEEPKVILPVNKADQP